MRYVGRGLLHRLGQFLHRAVALTEQMDNPQPVCIAQHLAEFGHQGVGGKRIVRHSNCCLSIHVFVLGKASVRRRRDVVTAALGSITVTNGPSSAEEINLCRSMRLLPATVSPLSRLAAPASAVRRDGMRCAPLLRIVATVLCAGPGVATQAAQSSDNQYPAHQYFAEGRYAAAEQEFTRELASGRSGAAIYYNRALARVNQQNYLGAKQDLDAHLALVTSLPALTLRAQVKLSLADGAGALADAEAALESAAHSSELLLVCARARLLLGRIDEARADLARILEREPQHIAALTARGDLALAQNEIAAAEIDYQKLAQIAPREPDAYYKLGLVEFRRLDFTAAIRSFEQAARLSPDSAQIERALGSAKYAAADFVGARENLQRAVKLNVGQATYARLLLYLVEQRLSSPALDVLGVPPGDGPDWTEQLVKFLRHEISEDSLFLTAQNMVPASERPGRLCEAHFYLGSARLIAGDLEAARYHLREADRSKQFAYTEHTLARAELRRLPVPVPTQPKRTRR
ncbi:MAG: hypothetical protein C0518_01810 [Opitutus sp.]|nr:hypothetical protein [Opitutus sp.]